MSEIDTNARDVQFDLTDLEAKEYGERLARKTREITVLKVKAKEVAGEYSRKVKGLEGDVSDLAEAITSRKELRPVLCEERVDARRFRVDTVRLDTNEVVDTRPMNESEMADAQQGQLFSDADARRAAPTDDPNGPADTGTLPNHPPLETVRGPEDRVPCPGPSERSDTGDGCTGDDCTRCAGAGFIPAEAAEADHADVPEADITDPENIVSAMPGEPAKGGRRGRGGKHVEAH